MRTSLCKNGLHRECGGQVNRNAGQQMMRLDDCSCACHSPQARPSPIVLPAVIRLQAFERDAYRCRAMILDICAGRADHAHHILQRSVGGLDELVNLLTVCWPCHDWIHANIAKAESLGLLRRSGYEVRR